GDTGFHESADTGDRTVTVPGFGTSPRRIVSVAYSTASLGDAAQKLPFVRAKATERFELPKDLPEGTVTEIAQCEKDKPSRKPYARFRYSKERGTIALPSGCHGVRFVRDGHAPGPWTKIDELDRDDTDKLYPKAGKLHFKVTTQDGNLLPARVLVRG